MYLRTNRVLVPSGVCPDGEDGLRAIAVQIVYSSRRDSRTIEHFGSAHDDGELEALKAAAAGRAG